MNAAQHPLGAPLLLMGVVLTAGALLIWAERRLLALWQDRLGPNRVGPFGILQPVADLIKLVAKEDWVPPFADRPLFVMAPAIAVAVSLAAFAVIPPSPVGALADLDIGLLVFLGFSSLGVYSQVLAGWASNSKYSLLGSLRGAAQLLSYEVFLGLAVMGVVIQAGTFNLREIVEAQSGMWFAGPQLVGLFLFLVAGAAEVHRLPFDLPESEQELVAGYHTEYSGLKFGLFYLGEYVGVLLIGALATTLYLGGWLGPEWLPPAAWFVLKTAVVAVGFVLLRASLPRPRYDQLMALGWKVLLPLALLNLIVTGAFVLAGEAA